MTDSRSARTDLVRTAAWTVGVLIALDLALGLVFRMPADPRTRPSALAQYFDFGRSLESKLRRMIGREDAQAAPVARAGWLDPTDWPADAPPPEGRGRVTVYGQSFTYAIGESLATLEPAFEFRARGGPAAPVSHLVAIHDVDRRRTASDIVILGVLASSLRGVDAATGATWMFESPYPYTYPRWRPDGDSLRAEWPGVTSLSALRVALAEPRTTRAWRDELARTDDWFSPLIFDASPLDASVVVRLLRRAWGQRAQRMHVARLHDRHGFREESGVPEVARRLVRRFAANARADGALPVVVLVHDRGYGDHLSRALAPALRQDSIPAISTADWVRPDDPANFVGDGHFSGAANRRLAIALHDCIVRERSRIEGRDTVGVGAARP